MERSSRKCRETKAWGQRLTIRTSKRTSKEAFQFPRLIRTCATKEEGLCWVQSMRNSGLWDRAGYPRTSEGNEKEKELKIPGSWEMTEEG